MRVRLLLTISIASVLAAGCATQSSAALDSLLFGFGAASDAPAQLDPRFRYLRVGYQGQAIYLVLGHVAPSAAGTLEVWYSNAGEVVEFRNGRLVGTADLPTDWREVRLPPLPDWGAVPPAGLRYTREVDRMPGYRYGHRETMVLRPVPPPADAPLHHVKAAALHWFEETMVDAGADALPPSRYGVDLRQQPARVVYSEQCISAQRCLTFEDWPVPAPGAPAAPPQPAKEPA